MQPVPIGVIGEIHISGIGVARGYLNQPAMTAENFIPNPFASQAGSRLYRTGDLARFSPDGSIEFLGRMDHQIKLRGYRIELGEIESIISKHEVVRDVAVMLREDEPSDKRIVAYLVVENNDERSIGEIRRYIKEKLPEYMVPTSFVVVEALPLTPNGKVDRKSLPRPDQTRGASGDEYVAPRSELEEGVARIWAAVLGVDKVGVNDNFFELGGHSLLATQVVSRIRDAYNIEVPLIQVFESPTVAQFAVRIDKEEAGQINKYSDSIKRMERADERDLLARIGELADSEVLSILVSMLAKDDISTLPFLWIEGETGETQHKSDASAKPVSRNNGHELLTSIHDLTDSEVFSLLREMLEEERISSGANHSTAASLPDYGLHKVSPVHATAELDTGEYEALPINVSELSAEEVDLLLISALDGEESQR